MTDIKEGMLYKSFEIEGFSFHIYYGYETAGERERGWEPTPIYPDFEEKPLYTKDGIPFTAVYSSPCAYYDPIEPESDDAWCANCTHFDMREEFIGLCKHPYNQKRRTVQNN